MEELDRTFKAPRRTEVDLLGEPGESFDVVLERPVDFRLSDGRMVIDRVLSEVPLST